MFYVTSRVTVVTDYYNFNNYQKKREKNPNFYKFCKLAAV